MGKSYKIGDSVRVKFGAEGSFQSEGKVVGFIVERHGKIDSNSGSASIGQFPKHVVVPGTLKIESSTDGTIVGGGRGGTRRRRKY